MSFRDDYLRQLPDLTAATAETAALQLFAYQAVHCPPYAAYLAALGRDPATVQRLADIPFLPIEFFKTHAVRTDPAAWQAQDRSTIHRLAKTCLATCSWGVGGRLSRALRRPIALPGRTCALARTCCITSCNRQNGHGRRARQRGRGGLVSERASARWGTAVARTRPTSAGGEDS